MNTPTPGRVLVVDDGRTNRTKLVAAVRALGHEGFEAESGEAALEALQNASADLVLLDIMMPGIDGFDVLAKMKGDHRLKDIPVIVISSLEDTSSVVKAIELGAEDFLPKNFDPVILRARVGTCLERKKFRDQEAEYLRQVNRLTKAAEVLEAGSFDPAKLGLYDIGERSDALGRLARVFAGMAQEVYERERRLRQNIRTLKGMMVLLLFGVTWSLIVPISRLASEYDAHPWGMTFWICLFGAAISLSVSAVRGTLPLWRNVPWRFCVMWAVLTAVVSDTFMYFVTGKVSASTVSIIIVIEAFLVFAFAAIMGIEQPSLRRFLGLALGLFGVLCVLLNSGTLESGTSLGWTALALLVPACYAFENVFLAAKLPKSLDFLAALGIMQSIAAMIVLPIAILFDDFFELKFALGGREVTVLLIAGVVLVSNCLYLYLIATTGSVFTSQNAYVVTIAGVAWSVVLLDESLSYWTWIAMSSMFLGLFFVGTKNEAESEPNQQLLEESFARDQSHPS